VANSGTLTMTNTTVADNRVAGKEHSDSWGGGIFSQGTALTLTRCTISGNSARGSTSNPPNSTPTAAHGGGVFSSGALNVISCTVSGNIAEGGSSLVGPGFEAMGGGILHAGYGTFNLSNSTISANSATSGYGPFGRHPSSGGGIYKFGTETANVKSTIVANNLATTSAPDAAGSFVSQGFNLIGKWNGSTGFTAATDRKGTIASSLDPKLGDLQNNGGRTQTMALLTGSPAIDQGTSLSLAGTLTTDQRGGGFPRKVDDAAIANAAGGDGTDIGSFELEAP
jgi:hypothetical protein